MDYFSNTVILLHSSPVNQQHNEVQCRHRFRCSSACQLLLHQSKPQQTQFQLSTEALTHAETEAQHCTKHHWVHMEDNVVQSTWEASQHLQKNGVSK